MSKETRWTYILIIASAVLVVIGAYVLITQARSLIAARDNLESARKELAEINKELAEKQAQSLVVMDALTASDDQAKMLAGVADEADVAAKVQIICAHQENINAEVRALCALSRWATGPSGRFIGAYSAAAARRAAATSPAEWNGVRAAYEALAPLVPRDLPGQQWPARIQEGLAYSDYQLGKLDEADREAARAWQLDDRSAFVGLTRLKIACAKKVPKEQIAQLYSQQQRNLEESVRNPRPGMDKRYAGFELSYFSRDPEVRLVCAYAELPAATQS